MMMMMMIIYPYKVLILNGFVENIFKTAKTILILVDPSLLPFFHLPTAPPPPPPQRKQKNVKSFLFVCLSVVTRNG